jgi:hypothetical protein
MSINRPCQLPYIISYVPSLLPVGIEQIKGKAK